MASEPGRFKFPLDGRVGVALLLTLVIEIMSCFGLAALRTLGEPRGRLSRDGALIPPVDVGDDVIETHEHSSPVTNKLVPEGAENIPSNSSLTAASLGSLTSREGRNLPRKQSLDVFTLCEKTTKARGDKGASFRARHFPKVDNKHGADVRLGPEPTLVSRLRFPKRTEFWQPSSMLELG